jgi:Fe-S cluster biosynthesis and repair protein YggX
MSRTVFCKKLNIEAEGLAFQTWPGELGKKVFENISQEAWGMWVNHQTMLINEYRLNPMDPKAKEMIVGEMEKFLFG